MEKSNKKYYVARFYFLIFIFKNETIENFVFKIVKLAT
jgi:hypothetical protein